MRFRCSRDGGRWTPQSRGTAGGGRARRWDREPVGVAPARRTGRADVSCRLPSAGHAAPPYRDCSAGTATSTTAPPPHAATPLRSRQLFTCCRERPSHTEKHNVTRRLSISHISRFSVCDFCLFLCIACFFADLLIRPGLQNNPP